MIYDDKVKRVGFVFIDDFLFRKVRYYYNIRQKLFYFSLNIKNIGLINNVDRLKWFVNKLRYERLLNLKRYILY